MKILVTGGAGFIGSHTIVELVNSGHTPIIVDDFSNSNRFVLKNLQKITNSKLKIYNTKFQDSNFLNNIFETDKIDGVIHFAAYKAVGESVNEPIKYYKNNVSGLVSLLEAMEVAHVSNLVFSSSCTVYGEPDKVPITENSDMKPTTSPYGATKQFGEIIIKDVTKISENLKSLSLRYFNPIGAHKSALIGELPLGVPANLVPFLTQTVAGLRDSLTVYGNNYNTPDGTCVRDYIHVVDLAKAHIKALEHLSNQKNGHYDVFNIGTGKGTSVLEIINTFEKATNKSVPYKIGKRRTGDLVKTYASANKANRLLKWRTEETLEDALLDAWNWQLKLNEEVF